MDTQEHGRPQNAIEASSISDNGKTGAFAVILWGLAILVLLFLTRWAAWDVRNGHASLQFLTGSVRHWTLWGSQFHNRSLEILPSSTGLVFVLPVLYLPFCLRRRKDRRVAKAWLLVCACASVYGAESCFLRQDMSQALLWAVSSIVLGFSYGLLSRKDLVPTLQTPALHHAILAFMVLVAALVLFHRIDRLRAPLYHGFAPWWAMKITEGFRIPDFWEGRGYIRYAVGGCINAYRSPLFMGSCLGIAEWTGSFLICARLAASVGSILTPIFAYLLARRAVGRDAALVAAAIGLLWPASLICGRCDTHMSWVTPWFLLSAWLLLRSGETASILTTLAAGGVVGLCLYPGYLYSPSRLIPLASGGFFLLGLIRSQKRVWRRALTFILLVSSVISVVALNPLDWKELLSEWTYGGDVSVNVPSHVPAFLAPYSRVIFQVFRSGLEKNIQGIGDILFTTKQGPLYHVLITPLLIPGFFALWGRRWFKHGLFLWPWLVFSLLPGLSPGPVYPTRIALLEALPALTAAWVLVEIGRQTFGKASSAAHAVLALTMAGTLGLWSAGWYFQDPRSIAEDRVVGLEVEAAQDAFKVLKDGLVLIEPTHHDEIERLSLLCADMTGQRTTAPSTTLRFLWPCLDRTKPQVMAREASGEDRTWAFLPQDWKGGVPEEDVWETSVYGATRLGLPLDEFHILERRHHPNIAFVKEPILFYADLRALLTDLQSSQRNLFLYVLNEAQRRAALQAAGLMPEELPGGLYLRALWAPGDLSCSSPPTEDGTKVSDAPRPTPPPGPAQDATGSLPGPGQGPPPAP